MSKKRSKARRTAKPAVQPVQAHAPVVAIDTVGDAETLDMPADDGLVAEAVASVETSDAASAEEGEELQTADVEEPAGDEADLPQVEPTLQVQAVPTAQAIAVDAHTESARFAPFDDPSAIRGVLIQVAGGRLLLPNATIAEVLSYAEPDPVGGDAPDWLLGRMRWRGWQLPLVAFSQLAGVGTERAGLGTKVVVLKALGGQGKTPYFAILTQGFPRLVTVSEGALARQDDEALPRGIQARVRLNQDDALLPDLEGIEGLIAGALAQAA